MDKKIVAFFYTETSENDFSESHKPSVLADFAILFKENNYRIFKKLGGIKIFDYYTSPKTHVRMSLWSDENGYSEWHLDANILEYLSQRKHHQKSNNISARLVGPCEITQYD